MGDMRRCLALLVLVLAATSCASFPDGAYFPEPGGPETTAISHALYRAARAAGDDPTRYSFALVRTRTITALSTEDATFYFSEGLARQPAAHVEALVAREVAHEVLGHAGQRRVVSLSLSAGFTVLGVVVPGLSLIDFVVNPLIVRAFTRDQELAADLKAVEILRSMGYEMPRRVMIEALQAAAAVNGPARSGPLATEPDLADRIAALDPPEPPVTLTAESTAPRQR